MLSKLDQGAHFRVLPERVECIETPDPMKDYSHPVKQYFFNIVDQKDGQVKILAVGPAIARQIVKHVESATKPKRNWFMRLLEWLRLAKPLPEPEHDFYVTRDESSFLYDIQYKRLDSRSKT